MKYVLLLCLFLSTAVSNSLFAQQDSINRQQLDYIYAVRKAIANFDKETYFDLMDNKIDTSFYIGLKQKWLAFDNYRPVMTNGEHWFDVDERQVNYWENVVYNDPDASWSWCKSMLDYYKAHVKSDDPSSIYTHKQNYNTINLYPNPANDKVTITDFADIQSIEVYDLLGKQRTAPSHDCTFNDYCLGESSGSTDPSYKRNEIQNQMRLIDSLKKAIVQFDKATFFNLLDNELDTSFGAPIRDYWISFDNYRPVMTEGEHWFDVDERQVNYWENVVYVEFENNSWSWCRSMLNHYKRKQPDPLSISTKKHKSTNLYPNPASKTVTITDFADIQSIEVYDLLGKQRKVNWNGTNQLDISSLQNGSYIVSIIYNSGEKAYTRLEKQ